MAKELDKVYDPKQVEDRTYQFWQEKKYFHADANSKKKPYTIVIPPPNITGQLHMGHALDNTLQDALIRWRRMQGYEALWLPKEGWPIGSRACLLCHSWPAGDRCLDSCG